MKIKVELEHGETMEHAEDFMEKSVKKKRECSGGERYSDTALNEFVSLIEAKNEKVISQIMDQLKLEIKRNARRR